MTNLPPYDLERALARQKSFVYPCVVVMLLYICLWIPGVVANYLWMKDAEHKEAMAGETLPGAGALRFMWACTTALALLFIAGACYAVLSGALEYWKKGG